MTAAATTVKASVVPSASSHAHDHHAKLMRFVKVVEAEKHVSQSVTLADSLLVVSLVVALLPIKLIDQRRKNELF
jgi:hypothetical protein